MKGITVSKYGVVTDWDKVHKEFEESRRIVEGGCPKCGSDLEVNAVAVLCVNMYHPDHPCSYGLMSG